MALVKATIKSEIKEAFTQVMNQQDDDREGAIDKVADKLADAVMNAIKSATITYTAGLTTSMGPDAPPIPFKDLVIAPPPSCACMEAPNSNACHNKITPPTDCTTALIRFHKISNFAFIAVVASAKTIGAPTPCRNIKNAKQAVYSVTFFSFFFTSIGFFISFTSF